jgi:hypothetical protein
VLFTLETLIITVSAGAVAALVLGFVSGKTKKRKRKRKKSKIDRSRIHEHITVISLRFLGIIWKVLRLEVSGFLKL